MSRTKQSARRNKAKAKRRDEPASGDDNGNTRNDQSKRQKTTAHTTTESAVHEPPSNAAHAAALEVMSTLLGGMKFDKFLSEYFEKKPLIVRKTDVQLFKEGLFSRKELLNVLQEHELQYGADLTVCRYKDQTRENYAPPDGTSKATKAQVGKLLDKGYSCQFYQPQRYIDGLYEINAAFEAVFGCLAGSSAYLTPPAAQALAPHHDDVEVFVLQTEGSKNWRLYHPITELAGEHSSDLSEDAIGDVWMEVTLHAGDLMYFPRGVIHQACTNSSEFSTHVTVSVYQHQTWANFMEVALPKALKRAFDTDVDFRRGLPVNFLEFMGTSRALASDKAKEFRKSLLRLVSKLSQFVTPEDLHEAADEAAMDFVANRLPPRSEDTSSSIPSFESGMSFRLHKRNFVRIVRPKGADYEEVYFSTKNCRRHHMGICDCDVMDEEEEVSNDAGSDEEEGDNEGEGEDNDDLEEEVASMRPRTPNSLAFPSEASKILQKLSETDKYISWTELNLGEDDMVTRGVLLRLWTEGLLDVRED